MANETDEKSPEQPMAGDDVMTIYGLTVKGIVDGAAKDAEKYAAGIQAKDATIAEHEETIKAHLDTIETLKQDLGVARLALQTAKTPAAAPAVPSMQRLPNGGVRVVVTLDQDAAVPLLSQAEQAGEDPAVYVGKQVSEALLAFNS